MKEIVIDEILYEGHRYQLDKPLTLKVKEIKETEEVCPKDSNSENFATSTYNGIPYQYYYTSEDPWKYCQHTYDNFYCDYDHWNYSYDNNNYDNWNYSYYSYDNNSNYNWNYSYNYYNKKDK